MVVKRQRRWFLIVVGAILLALPGLGLAANLLVSGTFETFADYGDEEWRGFKEKIGQGWTVTVLEEDGLHFMDSDTFGQFSAAIYGLPYLNYRIEGNYSQVFASRRAFDFVFSQTVSIDPGQDYALGGKIVTFWKGSGGERDDNKIFKRIGIDPSGGTSHTGPNVVWTDWEGLDNAWTSPALAVTAQNPQATVFIQVENIGDDVGAAYLNTGHLDSFRFELAPVASLNLPAQAAPGPLNVTWGVNIPDPGFWSLWGYDVEVKDNFSGSWQTIQTHDGNDGDDTSFSLNAEAGKTYTVRVRPWQERAPAGDPATTALPGMWQEKSVTIGQAVVGRVMNHMGLGLSGVTVSVQGQNSALSESGGQYRVPVNNPGTYSLTAANSGNLQAPPATLVTVTALVPTTFPLVLYPSGAQQAIQNNHFEPDLSFWDISDPAEVFVSPVAARTGNRGLSITGDGQASQSNTVSGLKNPLLSFWYRSEAPVEVQFLADPVPSPVGASAVALSRTLDPSGEWTFVTLELGSGSSYSGELGVKFINTSGSTAIDEVSIGPGPGKLYLPVIAN